VISVLYVDDEPDMLDICKMSLEESGTIIVDTLPSATTALQAVGSKKYDVIVSDYRMPGTDGIEFLRRIRNSGSRVPFIIFTGHGGEDIAIQALNEGADFYLRKGGNPTSGFAELSRSITLAVQQRRNGDPGIAHDHREADIIDFLPDATFVIDNGGKIVAWNRAIERMTGIPAGAMLGKGDYEYAIPFYGTRRPILIDLIFAGKEKIAQSYSGIIREGSTLIAETPHPRPRGEQRHVWAKASPLYNEKGEITGAIESIRDITEIRSIQSDLLKKNEELSITYEEMMAQDEELRANLEEIQLSQKALQQSEQRLRGIADAIPGVVYQFYARDSGEMGVSYVSDQCEQLFGIRSDLPALLPLFTGHLAPEDKDSFNTSISDAIARQSRWDFEGRFIRDDGRVIFFHAMSEPVRADTELVFSGVILDITDRKEAESAVDEITRRMGEIIDFLPDATFVIDREGTIVAWNRAMEELTGYPGEKMVGKGNYEYAIPIYGRPRPILIDLVFSPEKVLRQNYTSLTFEGNVVTGETVDATLRGKKVVLWGKAAPLSDSKGTIVGAIEALRDVTGQHMHEEALSQANRKLNLLSSITRHDIINKITVCLGLLDLFKNGYGSLEPGDFCEKMRKNVKDIYNMIEFTRMYQEIGIAAPSWQDIGSIVLMCNASRIRVISGITGISVYADPMLSKVFLNLLDNTLRHGGHATEVTVNAAENRDGTLTIAWQDNGCGVADTIKEQIFDRGFGSNTGFGLFLTREVLSLTGITIIENGVPGQGARFEITVPKDKFRVKDL
jgi:PAS domain S-box-containing protein